MDEKTFRAMVFRARPPALSDESVNMALESFIKKGRVGQAHKADCIEFAHRIAVYTAGSQEDTKISEHRFKPLTPGITMVSNELTRRITPEAKQIRQVLFGSTDAPFSSYEEVAAWLEQMGQHQAYTLRREDSVNGNSIGRKTTLAVQNPEIDQQVQDLERKLCEWYTQWSKLTGETVLPSFPPRVRYLPYVRPGALGRLYVEDFVVCANSPLAKLCEISHTMAGATGFFQHSVVMYILMDIKPLLDPFRIRIERKPYPTLDTVRVQATLEIETPDITDVQWRAIHQEIRQAWGVENTTRVDEDDEQLQNIVEQLGGVPQRGEKMAFWEKVCQEWNRQELQKAELKPQQGCTYTPNRHKNGKVTRMRYQRLTAKLATQVSGAGKQGASTMTLQTVRSWDGIEARRTLLRQLSRNNTQK